MQRHPHHFTLEILRNLVVSAPGTFPADRRVAILAECDALVADPKSRLEEIEGKIMEFGKEIWPYRKAFDDLHDRYSKSKEEALMREKLDSGTLSKMLEFTRDGGRLEDVRHGALLEESFDPEEKFAIGQALLAAHETVKEELEKQCAGEKKAEFEEVVKHYQGVKEKLINRLDTLRGMGEASPKWAGEISEKVRAFEEGFGFMGREFTREDINGAIEYYRDVIEETEKE
ncbi:MAG: hypothetical protein AAB444_00060 [Patescibacteria group bacterium]